MEATLDEKGKTLTITLPLTPGMSKSGKSLVIASTRGNVTFPDLTYKGKPVTVGVNAYTANA